MGPDLDAGEQLRAVGSHPPIVETTPAERRFVWVDEAATQAFAATLAAQPGIANAYLELDGDLGAGKTTFVRHLLRALGVSGRIKSPTYAVVEPHEAPRGDGSVLAIWHFDFYRFGDPREWEDAGFRELFASPGLKLAEWPAHASGLVPAPDLALKIEAMDDDTSRTVTVQARSPRGQALLAALPA